MLESAGLRWSNAKQAIYAVVGRTSLLRGRRPGGVEIATTNKSDGLKIQVITKCEGNHVIPVTIEAIQKDGEILIDINGVNCYRQKINP